MELYEQAVSVQMADLKHNAVSTDIQHTHQVRGARFRHAAVQRLGSSLHYACGYLGITMENGGWGHILKK